MSRRHNEAFLNSFLELDKLCCDKFGVISGGVTEYINRLNNARYAPDREEVLPKLVRYRNLRNRFAHEPGAIRKTDDINKEDIKWVNRFRRDMEKKRDPISKYLRKARRYAFRKKLKRIFVMLLILALVAAGITLYFLLSK